MQVCKSISIFTKLHYLVMPASCQVRVQLLTDANIRKQCRFRRIDILEFQRQKKFRNETGYKRATSFLNRSQIPLGSGFFNIIPGCCSLIEKLAGYWCQIENNMDRKAWKTLLWTVPGHRILKRIYQINAHRDTLLIQLPFIT